MKSPSHDADHLTAGGRITRRRILQLTGASALAATGNGWAAQETQKSKRIIIAGGGIGGLCCAYELMERGHEVTVLEASRRTGGHVKTIHDLPDGLYADVGAEHFTKPGYTQYWKYVNKFQLDYLPYHRRENMYRHIDGQWRTEQELQDPKVLKAFGFNEREITYILEHGWAELPSLYFGPYVSKFKNEYQPFGVGLDDLDHIVIGDQLAKDGASDAALRFCSGGRKTTAAKPATENDVSALFRIWQASIAAMRGLPNLKREVFRLKGGNQVLPDTFAAKLGDRIHLNCPISHIERGASSVNIHYTEHDEKKTLQADYLVICLSPLLLPRITVTPEWPAEKAYALFNTPMGMQSRVVLQSRTAFWKADVPGNIPSINLETGDPHMQSVWETADEVPGESSVLIGSAIPAQSSEDALAAFRKFYPGKAKDTIERCIVHQWWKEEPYAFGCERLAFKLGHLSKIWPQLIQPVGPIYFAGAAYDNLPWGMDAATRSANRVAEQIHVA